MVIHPLILIIGFVASVGAGIAVGGMMQRIKDLAQRGRDLLQRVNDLEEMLKRKRHTYPTNEGLEDALAVAIDLILKEDTEAEYRKVRYRQLQQILGIVREGPHAYDGDRPHEKPPEPS